MIPFALFFLSLIIHWVDAVTRTDIVILGAGATGISAAATLTEQGEKDFILVDGQSFIGGSFLSLYYQIPSRFVI